MTTDSKRFTGKTALVTGGASGIGQAAVERFAREGASVMITDVNESTGASFAKSLGSAAAFHKLDVASEDAWKSAVSECIEHFGSLDILVNNAGIGFVEGQLTP